MTRTTRLALLAALSLLVVVTGSALAMRGPSTVDQPDLLAASQEAEPETDTLEDAEEGDGAEHAHRRLTEVKLDIEAAEFEALAEKYGVGGAVRLVAWADATGRSIDELAAMRDDDGSGQPMGWGVMAKELGVHPGIGSVMGRGNGNAPDVPPGLEKKQDD